MPAPDSPVGPPTQRNVIGALRTFRYEAQSIDGKRITGVIDAEDPVWVSRQLAILRLRLVRLEPVQPGDLASAAGPLTEAPDIPKQVRSGKPIRGDDFLAFNQQLAHLAKAGLPIESGLRLIAKDMRSGRLAQTIKSVADELDQGVPIGQAFEKHRGQFPSLYGRLLDAGVASGDLAGVLLGFGAHLEMLQRLRSALWRTLSYPLAVLTALAVVLLFLGHYVIPRFAELYAGFATTSTFDFSLHIARPILGPHLPLPTQFLIYSSEAIPYVAAFILASLIMGPIVWQFLRLRGWDRNVVDAVVLRLPLVGRAVRLNLVARWCDAMRIGVTAGLPLPAAIELACDAVRSPRLHLDGRALISRLEKGQPLAIAGDDRAAPGKVSAKLWVVPATVPVAIELASGHNNLPETLRSLTELYDRQAQGRVNGIPAILSPLLVIVVAVTIGFVILALLLPLIQMLDHLMRMF